jgi:radical SAM protein with 4Fe4S-binding SPASM domain
MAFGKHPKKRLLLQWHITERCGARCRHCYQNGQAQAELPLAQLLSILDQYKALLDQWRGLSRQHIGGHITITGGDPFMREDFFQLLENLAGHRKWFTFAVLTNGLAIDGPTARSLESLSPQFVQLSLEGGRSVHDHLRGEGSFDRTTAAIAQLVLAGIPTLIAFTAHKGNFREFSKVAAIGRKLGVTRIWADRLVPLGRGGAMASRMLNPRETWELFVRMDKERAETNGKTRIAMHRALQFMVAGGEPYRCTAGDTLLTILSNGDLVPCRRMPIVAGNVLHTAMADLYFGADLFRQLRDRTHFNAECAMCRHASTCRGGLRCLAHAVYGDPFKADPGCWVAGLKVA